MKTIAKINLDLQRPNFATEVDAMQDDGETRVLAVSLTSGGTPWNVPEGAAPMVVFRRPNYTKGMYDQLADGSPAISVDGNTVTVVLSRQMLAVPGQVRASLQFEDAQLNMLTTFPFKINVQANPYGGAQSVQDVVRLQWLEDELGKWLKKAAESGEFDGPPGPAGKTPEKGVDYFTAEEAQQFEDAVYNRASEKINPAIEKAENAATAANDAAAAIPGQIAGKLDKPSAQPAVGQILKVQKINPDGTFVVGWADDGGGTVQDVQINGDTIVQDGVANIQLSSGLTHRIALGIATPTQEQIAGRNPAMAITGAMLDSGVKAAMCDGKGPAWTAEEQVAARDRIGLSGVKLIADITLESEVSVIKIAEKIAITEYVLFMRAPKSSVAVSAAYLSRGIKPAEGVDDFGKTLLVYNVVNTDRETITYAQANLSNGLERTNFLTAKYDSANLQTQISNSAQYGASLTGSYYTEIGLSSTRTEQKFPAGTRIQLFGK